MYQKPFYVVIYRETSIFTEGTGGGADKQIVIDGRADGQTIGRTDGRTDIRMDIQTNEDGLMDDSVYYLFNSNLCLHGMQLTTVSSTLSMH